MKHVLKVSRRLKSQSEALNSSPLWISDALLRDTFDHFSKGCRRHGSHVPGPLEGRRRATRRKNTSIAYTGASPAPIDAAGLFGSEKQGAWWKQTQVTQDSGNFQRPEKSQSIPPIRSGHGTTTALNTIFPWFGNPPPPPTPRIELNEKEPDAAEGTQLSKADLKAQELIFQEDLRSAENLDDLRLLVQQRGLPSSQTLVFRTLALQHMLESKWSLGMLKEFVLDPVLNPPGAKPFRVMGNALIGKWLDHTTRAGLFGIICQLFTLGVAPPEEVRRLYRKIPRFQIFRGTGFVRLGEDPAIHDYYRSFLSSMEESKVISIRDLDNKAWWEEISRSSFTPAAAYLLWEMRHYSSRSQENLASTLLSRLVPFNFQNDSVAVQETDLARFLAVLPTSILPSVLIEVTQAMMCLSINEGGHDVILRWQDLLETLSDRKVQRIFSWTQGWTGYLSVRCSTSERAQRVAIASWVAVTISKRMRQAEEHLRKLKLRNIFRELYSNPYRNGTRDVLAQFLETLQGLPLPNKILLLSRLRFVTDDYLVVHNEDFVLRISEKDLMRRFSVLQNDVDYDHFRSHFNDALVDLAESVNNDLSLFLHVSRYFIEKDESAFRIVLRILKHNLALHNALSQSWPDRFTHYQGTVEAPAELTADPEDVTPEAEQHSPSIDCSIDACKRVTSSPRLSSRQRRLDPRQVLDLINHLAVSFATSPVIEPRQAVRRVYWCFEMLHRYGAPIESPITRALWHAGVTRQGGNGTANTLLRWIVQQIRIVEGNHVADNLLRSAGFRERMEAQLEDWTLANKTMPPPESGETVFGALQRKEVLDHEVAKRSPGTLATSRRAALFDKEDIVITKLRFKTWRPIQNTRMAQPRK